MVIAEVAGQSLSQRVAERADQPRSSTLLLDMLIAPFYALGWTVFWVLLVAVGVARWCTAAVALGWSDARAQAQTRGFAANRWPVKQAKVKPRGAG